MSETIARIAAATGMPYDRVYEILKTIRQFDAYAENEANESSSYDAGFAGGLRESLKMRSGISNWDIDAAIKETIGEQL